MRIQILILGFKELINYSRRNFNTNTILKKSCVILLTYQFSYLFFILKYLNTTRNKRGSLAKRILLKINLGKKERDFQRLPFHYNAWNMLHVNRIRQFFSAIKLTVQTTYKNLLEMETAV